MHGPMYKVVDDSERLRKPKSVRKPNRWDKIANLIEQDKTIFVEYKWAQAIKDSLKRRGILNISASKRPGGYVIWKRN